MLHLSRLPLAAMLCVAAGAQAQSTNPGNSSGNHAPGAPSVRSSLNLPRLGARGSPPNANALAGAKATVDELGTMGRGNVREVSRRSLRHLAVDAGTSWSRPLRGGPRDTVFVSFLVYGSDGTVIDVAGARLAVRTTNRPGYAQLHLGRTTNRGVQWLAFGGPIRLEPHGGQSLAALPVLTVRIDRTTQSWDLYVFNRLSLTDQPLAALPPGAPNQFTVRAGSAGALISGLVSADENPLYEDENANGIDDAFERQSLGALLAVRAPAADRAPLARQWQQDQQRRQLIPWPVQRPLPDGTPAGPPRKG